MYQTCTGGDQAASWYKCRRGLDGVYVPEVGDLKDQRL
jgi:hypothetical protein